MGRDGKLYQAKEKKVGNTWYYTDQPDRSKSATQQEAQLWMTSAQALGALDQAELATVQQMADAGIENPNRLQSLLVSSEKEHWAKRAAKWAGKSMVGYSGPGLMYRGAKRVKQEFGREPSGTFAQKVQQGIVKPQPRQPSAQATPKAIRQRNKRTGQERISYDGGKTWQMSG